MTAKQKAIFTLIYFIIMAILTYPCTRFIWVKLCTAGGITPEEAKIKARELNAQHQNTQMFFKSWLLENAKDKSKVERLYKLYSLSIVPAVIPCMFSFMGLFTHAFDVFLHVSMILVPVYLLVLAVVGKVQKNRKK